MALDEAISMACGKGLVPPTLRFYGWNPPAVSIGYFQKSGEEELLGPPGGSGISIVRRPTGGRAVFHHLELTYSVSARTDNPLFPRGVEATYRVIAEALICGLRHLGIRADIFQNLHDADHPVPRSPSPSPSCFASPYGHEIAVSGRKLVGSAQRRRRDFFLQHGSILRSPDPLFQAFFRNPEGGPPPITLQEVLGRPVDDSEVIPMLCLGFREVWKIDFKPGEVHPVELELAYDLERTKYATKEWNFKR
jgi:lipoate-protein ligase A